MAERRKPSPQGILPVWQFHGRETRTMVGYHAVPVIADAYMKGVGDFDANEALDAMVASAEYAPDGGLGDYMTLGYVPIDREPEAAPKTVEYAYDDWTIARMAEKLGRKDIAERFAKRAGYWRNSFDAKTGWLRVREADGSFRTPFDPTAINYIAGLIGQYVLGRPFVDRAVLTLPDGKCFTVEAPGLSDTNRYVGKVELNGKSLARSWISDSEIRKIGTLRFTMQAAPNKAWRQASGACSYSMSAARQRAALDQSSAHGC